jgi:SAM-dependent methyltransferase
MPFVVRVNCILYCYIGELRAIWNMAIRPRHSPDDAHGASPPSDWVRRFAPLVRPAGPVLDVACGSGRHSRFFLALGHPVTAVDRAPDRLAELSGLAGAERVEADLEAGPWPLAERTFAAVVVTNYLFRPLFPTLLAALEPGGVLIYETFARGNARFGRPANPDHLLAPGELLECVRGRLHVVAYEHGIVTASRRAALERIAAVNRPADPDGLSLLPSPPGTLDAT